ncbi:Nif3-like dinuclear metal center hexameric protein [Clostridia bacterium]|nr:Nif3-like dinuclear metal center hexameric protein [Clostridia bacterium]
MKIKSIVQTIEEIAPTHLKESWDHVGLMVGELEQEVESALFAMDITDEIIDEAISKRHSLIVTHHPFLFKALQNIDYGTSKGRMIRKLIKHDIAVYSAHTNFDAAAKGVSEVLADLLGLADRKRLDASPLFAYKLVFFIPVSKREKVLESLFEAGAGTFDKYDHASFCSQGLGSFQPQETANPTLGKIGELTTVEECRVELLVPKNRLEPVLSALILNHPYEEVAYDVYELRNQSLNTGIGVIGSLEDSMTLISLAGVVKERLRLKYIRIAGDAKQMITKVAVCGGAGKQYYKNALSMGAQVLITGDVDYHTALDCQEAGICLIDATHFATERPAMEWLCWYVGEQVSIPCAFSDFSQDVIKILE